MPKKVRYLVFLNDQETYSEIEGCLLVGMLAGNYAAVNALDSEEFEELFQVADVVEAIEPPSVAMGQTPSGNPPQTD